MRHWKLKNKFAWTIAWLVSPLFFFGCSTWRFAPEKDDVTAKQFALIPGKVSVYVYRADSTNAQPLTLAMGERHHLPDEIFIKPLCWLYPNTFLNFEVLEGTYQLMGIKEGPGRIKFADMLIGLRPDQLYFFKMDDRGLVRVMEPEGKLAVQQCRLVKGQYHE